MKPSSFPLPTKINYLWSWTQYKMWGFPGCKGCVDGMHRAWKNCPNGWMVQLERKEKTLAIILKAVAAKILQMWYVSLGTLGVLNNIHVLSQSLLFDKYINGKFLYSLTNLIHFSSIVFCLVSFWTSRYRSTSRVHFQWPWISHGLLTCWWYIPIIACSHQDHETCTAWGQKALCDIARGIQRIIWERIGCLKKLAFIS